MEKSGIRVNRKNVEIADIVFGISALTICSGAREDFFDRREALPVVAGRSQAGQRGLVLAGAVADVTLPAEAGMVLCEGGHDAVARHLGDDRGGGDRGAPPISSIAFTSEAD